MKRILWHGGMQGMFSEGDASPTIQKIESLRDRAGALSQKASSLAGRSRTKLERLALYGDTAQRMQARSTISAHIAFANKASSLATRTRQCVAFACSVGQAEHILRKATTTFAALQAHVRRGPPTQRVKASKGKKSYVRSKAVKKGKR